MDRRGEKPNIVLPENWKTNPQVQEIYAGMLKKAGFRPDEIEEGKETGPNDKTNNLVQSGGRDDDPMTE